MLPFLRSSDDIASLPLGRKLLLPASPLYAGPAQQALQESDRRGPPRPAAPAQPVPAALALDRAHRPGGRRTGRPHGAQLSPGLRQRGVLPRRARAAPTASAGAFPLPAVVHSCYRGSRAQSVVMATTLAAHRGTWLRVDRFIALTDAIAEHLVRFGVDPDRIMVKPNAAPDPGPPDPLGDGFLLLGRLVEEKGVRLLLDAWSRHPDGSLGPLRIVGRRSAAGRGRGGRGAPGPTSSSSDRWTDRGTGGAALDRRRGRALDLAGRAPDRDPGGAGRGPPGARDRPWAASRR